MVKILAVVALAFMALAGVNGQMYNDEIEYTILDASEYEVLGLGGYGGGLGGGHGGYGAGLGAYGGGKGGYGGGAGLEQQIVGLPTVIQGGGGMGGPFGMGGPGGKKGGGGAMNILIGVPTPVHVQRQQQPMKQQKVRTVYVERPVYIHEQAAAPVDTKGMNYHYQQAAPVDTKGMNYHYQQHDQHDETAEPIYEEEHEAAAPQSTKGQYQQQF